LLSVSQIRVCRALGPAWPIESCTGSDRIDTVWIFLLIFSLLLPLSSQGAVDSADCLGCHDKLAGVSHGGVTCTGCHNDIKELPHGEKLEKPICRSCHRDAVAAYTRSIHSSKKLLCKTCHNSHLPSKEKKTCTSCHNYAHGRLPSKAKHLRALECLACHGNPQQGRIDIKVTLPKGETLGRTGIDKDGNKLVDGSEWGGLMVRLKKDHKKPVPIKKSFLVSGSAHNVTDRTVDCQACHGPDGLFKSATLSISGDGGVKLPIESKIFLPDLPDIERYRQTPHGKKGVKCGDCHVSQERIDDSVCSRCHREAYDTYKGSSHAKKQAAWCTDCHNPHSVVPYVGLTAEERVNICAKCHKDYLKKHEWLPNTMLHFKYLECSSCHSPGSTKSIVFYLGAKRDNGQTPLKYQDIEKAHAANVHVRNAIDKNRDNAVTSEELSYFFHEMRERLKQPLFIGSSIITTKVHHDYSVKEKQERLCSTCHSERAPFYDSMFLILPEKSGQTRIPVKGTILSALPTSIFTDMYLLGETKIRREDWQNIVRASGKKRTDYIRELGFKWIDFGGVVVILFALIVIGIHIIGRVIFKR
jgi:predicted CXXCH cytochrome family protein